MKGEECVISDILHTATTEKNIHVTPGDGSFDCNAQGRSQDVFNFPNALPPPPPPHAPKGEVTVSLSVFTVSLQCRRAVQAFSLSAQCAREIAMLKLPKRGGDGASQRER